MAGVDREGVESMMAKVALECGRDISASQEDILARSSFLGVPSEEEEEEPPHTQQDPITMCTLPFTQSQSPTVLDDDQDDDYQDDDAQDDTHIKPRWKPRVCIRKVRGARIRTPTPSPAPKQRPPQHPQAVDPLYRAVLMIPTAATAAAATTTTTTTRLNPVEDFLALARHRGIL